MAKAFNKTFKTIIESTDFDVSDNRYLDTKLLANKERKMRQIENWAIKDSNNLKKYQHVYEERLKYLRAAGSLSNKHVEAVRKWWEEKLNELYRLKRKKHLPFRTNR